MSRLFDAYRSLHEQCFIPIFANDDFDSMMLLEACVNAGVKCIEYTLRRHDADKMIPWIREHYPELYLLVGSTIDDNSIVAQMKRKHPQLLTIAELDMLEVDGFVSMIGWSNESITRYSPYRLVIPSAMTANEAFHQTRAGAHFIKMLGPNLDLVKICRVEASFGYCPIMFTGGMDIERLPNAIAAGTVVIGTGFDVILKGQPSDMTAKQTARMLLDYLKVASEARARYFPEIANSAACDDAWLDSLPHYHQFQHRESVVGISRD